MIEFRGSLLVDKNFEGGFKLKKGTVIYARETQHGWLGMYYEEKGSGHGFHLEETDFSIWTNVDGEREIIWMKEEPESPSELMRVRQLEIEEARRRVEIRSKAYHQAMAELERLVIPQ